MDEKTLIAGEGSSQSSFHGIAARLDRMPRIPFQRKVLWLLGGVTFADCCDMNVGGPIIAQLLASGWSDSGLNAMFVSITMVGYFFGGLMAGALSDGIGRKKSVIICTTIFSIGCFAAASAPNMHLLTACRFLMGLGLGAAFPAAYSALTEYTPPYMRGKYQSWVGLIGNCGVFASSVLSLVCLPLVGWRPIFIVCGIMGAIIVILNAKFLDESPRWLASKGRLEEAERIMAKYETQAIKLGVELEPVSEELIAQKATEHKVEQLSWGFLFSRKMITRTLTAMFLCFTMITLVYTIQTWTPTIFVMRGFDVTYSTMMTVVMQLGIPVGAFLLSFYVEKVNRKTILIVTFVLCAIGGFLWSCIPSQEVIAIMACGFLLEVVTITNSVMISAIYLSEPFPTECRIRGAGVANAFGRIAGILSPIWITALLNSQFGATGVYTLNAVIAIFMAVWLWKFGIETRGRTLEEITKDLYE